MSSRLSICIFVPVAQIVHSLTQLLSGNGELSVCDRYHLHILNSVIELKEFVIDNKEKLDCLIILNNKIGIEPIINEFYEQGLILPVIILEPDDLDLSRECLVAESENKIDQDNPKEFDSLNHLYHTAEVRIRLRQLGNITKYIDKAIAQFLHLAPSCSIIENSQSHQTSKPIEEKQNFLLLQQKRLAEKLKERLGYLGVYYNRNPNYFYRYLSKTEKDELIKQLKVEYRDIILEYFSVESEVNQAIDQFVNQCFFADLSVSQILEIHMELMDEFAQQLKLEGRNEDILIDYRLALIDLIAHLCEMYRRSIPKEDLPFEILFPVD
ncbi:circadian clock protein KaiA [Geminocystis sp. NIES-3708]|uniref:circadian clock protein KaiA n=1 Tax=Geminocystis sp. NIES-3708 TaxID=1615909 RepID=UPI0005FCC52A|nr:circadian clock protein KaiA [Geminocystis sp. NIES-3708]BAQ59946.1 circadian clock protein KaiA [Geminocystis sp. NIES-3708]